MAGITEKQCSPNTGCGQTKPISAFFRSSKSPDGWYYKCTACHKAGVGSRGPRKAKAKIQKVKLEGLSGLQKQIATELVEGTKDYGIPPMPTEWTLETIQRYVRNLMIQERAQGGAFHPFTKLSMIEWKKRLVDKVGKDEADKFISEVQAGLEVAQEPVPVVVSPVVGKHSVKRKGFKQ